MILTVSFMIGTGVITGVLDVIFLFSEETRIFIDMLLLIVLSVYIIYILYAHIFTKPDYSNLAKIVQRKYPELRDDITNVLELSVQYYNITEVSVYCINKSCENTSLWLSEKFSLNDFKRAGYFRNLVTYLLILVLYVFSMYLFFPDVFKYTSSRFVLPKTYMSLTEMLKVSPGSLDVIYGSDQIIQVYSYNPLKKPVLFYKGEQGIWTKCKLKEKDKNEFVYTFKKIKHSFKYYIKIEFIKTPKYKINVMHPPVIGSISVKLNYPDYAGIASTEFINTNGDIELLRGTRVELKALSNKSLNKASINYKKSIIPMRVSKKNIEGTFTADKQGVYHIDVLDEHGLKNSGLDHSIIFIADQMPFIEIKSPSSHSQIDYRQNVLIHYKASDDFGISKVILVYKINQQKENSIVIFDNRTEKDIDRVIQWELIRENIRQGDEIEYYLKAYDHYPYVDIRARAGQSRKQTLKAVDANYKRRVYADILEEIQSMLYNTIKDQGRINNNTIKFTDVSKTFEITKKKELIDKIYTEQKSVFNNFNKIVDKTSKFTADEDSMSADTPIYWEYKAIHRDMKEVQDTYIDELELTFGRAQYLFDVSEFNAAVMQIMDIQKEFLAYLKRLSILKQNISRHSERSNMLFGLEELMFNYESFRKELSSIDVRDLNNKKNIFLKRIRRFETILKDLQTVVEKMVIQGDIEIIKDAKDISLDLTKMMNEMDLLKNFISKGDLTSLEKHVHALENKLKNLRKYKEALENTKGMVVDTEIHAIFKQVLEKVDVLIKQEEGIQAETNTLNQKRIELLLIKQKEYFPVISLKLKNLEHGLKQDIEAIKSFEKEEGSVYQNALKTIKKAINNVNSNIAKGFDKSIVRILENFDYEISVYRDVFEGSDQPVFFIEDIEKQQLYQAVRKQSFSAYYDFKEKFENIIKDLISKTQVPASDFDDLSKKFSMDLSKLQHNVKLNVYNLKHDVVIYSTSTAIFSQGMIYSLSEIAKSMNSAQISLKDIKIDKALSHEQKALEYLYLVRDELNNIFKEEGGLYYSLKIAVAGNDIKRYQRKMLGGIGETIKEGYVAVPKETDYKVPKRYRQKIIDASKEERPKRYKKLIHEYYKRIIE
ncbi:hypothetical protein ACFL4O_02510, partial [bacterium]